MILYHGSTSKYDVLIPHQAYDTGYEEGCQNAVYATSEKAMAIGFALGAKEDENGELEREMMPQCGYKMVFKKGSPNYGGKGYIYVLDGSKFTHAMGSQWVCFDSVKPLEVIEIEVDDYLEYAVIAKELKDSYNTHIRNIKLLDIQPSQFYISQEKINKIKEWFHPQDLSNFEPIPIKELNGNIIFTDGHTRAWVAYEAGLNEVPVVWDEDDLDWELYQKCVDACLDRGVKTIADLKERVLSPEDYVIKWDYWCDELQEKHAYLKNPCGKYSIPYWKSKCIQISENMKIIHDRDFEESLLLEYNDEKYFRLMHDLNDVNNMQLEGFYIESASVENIPLIQELINGSYEDLSVTRDQLLGYTKSKVYDESLWIIIYEKSTNKPIACGIAELDKEMREGILEWIQVLPEYRGKKIGQCLVNELLARLQGKADFVTVSGKIDNKTNPENLYRKCRFTGNDVWHILIKKEEN